MKFAELARQAGIDNACEFDAVLLIPQERIRAFCHDNKCGNYGRNYMCPPHIGTLEEIAAKLKKYRRGILLQHSAFVDGKGDRDIAVQTKIEFHRKVLRLEELMMESGAGEVWGMIGGNCPLCQPCAVTVKKPCPYPGKARTSMEGIGIDVLGLLDKFGLDSKFYDDRINWTGCILIKDKPAT